MLLDGDKPKVTPSVLRKVIEEAGIGVSESEADFGIVVGGDGRFSKYGRLESIPLLFVGVRSNKPTGSKAFLAGAYFDELPRALRDIRKGRYSVDEHKRLEIKMNGNPLGEIFTDVYLERGAESTSIRYRVKTTGRGVGIEDAAIGDGVVVTTRAGSTGYYSYPDRIKGNLTDPSGFSKIRGDEVGICHVVPSYTKRTGSEIHPLRYTVPWGSMIAISLFRPADARLYGTSGTRKGLRVKLGDQVTVGPGKNVTRVISLSR